MKQGWPLLILSLLSLPARAGESGLSGSAWLGLSGTAFDYEEFNDQGASLDREQGWLPGATAGLGLESGPAFVEAGLWWSRGRVDYSAPGIDTETDEDIRSLELLAGAWFIERDRTRAGLIAGAGYRVWRRDILSTATASGLDETYRWGYGLLGLRGELTYRKAIRVVAEFQLTRTFNPDIEVDFDGRFDDVSLALGEETGFRASLSIERNLDSGATLWLAPWYEYWELGRSDEADLFRNGAVVGTVFEPRSETANFGISIGLSWRFEVS